MKTFPASKNDGTLVISNAVKEPAQGTWISDHPPLVVAKGIVRPRFRNPQTGEVEEEAHCIEAAFGRKLGGEGKFYRLGEVGDQNSNLALQTVLFSAADPDRLIFEDSARFEKQTALDLLGRDAKRKVLAGVPLAFLLEDMAPWDAFRRFDVPGIRSTVYGSHLVPLEATKEYFDEAYANSVVRDNQALKRDTKKPCFMLLRSSAAKLARQLGVEPYEMIGRWFLVHRDPALPDGTSLYPSMYLGILEWDNEAKASSGIIFNPEDPYWASCGGDFDGDAAAIYVPSSTLLPKGAVSRPDFKLNGRKFNSEVVAEQMIEATTDTVTSFLGPVILSAMRLVERDVANDNLRGIMAGVAQGSVQAKKHAVDNQALTTQYNMILSLVKEHAAQRPFVSDYINGVRNAVGLDGKIEAWKQLAQAVEQGTWIEGTPIEQALAYRVRMIQALIAEVDYFRHQKNAKLPQPMVDAAKALCKKESAEAIKTLASEYRKASFDLVYGEHEEEELKETQRVVLLDRLSVIRGSFALACTTGKLNGVDYPVKDIHVAMIAYGPPKLAARLVPAATFEEVGVNTKFLILSLMGHDYTNGVYTVEDLTPIPSMMDEFVLFAGETKSFELEVLHQALRSTRVKLTAL